MSGKGFTHANSVAMCDTEEESSGARCHKDAGHEGPHNGWAHYPGQLVSWPRVPSTSEGEGT